MYTHTYHYCNLQCKLLNICIITEKIIYIWVFFIYAVPLNRGHISHTPYIPFPEYCDTTNSIKYKGIPQNISAHINTNTNAPENKNRKSFQNKLMVGVLYAEAKLFNENTLIIWSYSISWGDKLDTMFE